MIWGYPFWETPIWIWKMEHFSSNSFWHVSSVFFSTGHVEAFLLAISPCFLVVFPLCLLHIKLRLSFVYSWHVSGLTLINTRQVAQIIFHVYSSFHSHEITGQKNLCSLNCTLSQCLMRTVPHVVFIQYITVP